MGNLKEEEVYNNALLKLKEGETMRLPEWDKFWYKKNGEIYQQKNKESDEKSDQKNISLRKDWIVEFIGFAPKKTDVRIYKNVYSDQYKFMYLKNNNKILDVMMVKIKGVYFLLSVDGMEDHYGKHYGRFHVEEKQILDKYPNFNDRKKCQLVLASDDPSYNVSEIDFDSLKKGYDIMFDVHNKKYIELTAVKITQLKVDGEWVSLRDENLGVEREGEYRGVFKLLHIKE